MENFAIYSFPIGFLRIDCDGDKVISIGMVDEPRDMGCETELAKLVKSQLDEYFAGKRRRFDFPYELRGTEFQKKVWSALCGIPYGDTRTYKQIAEAVGNPQACRAVGMANNKNPMMIVVPCHRVVGAGGKLVGYACGVDVKERLLKLEAGQ